MQENPLPGPDTGKSAVSPPPGETSPADGPCRASPYLLGSQAACWEQPAGEQTFVARGRSSGRSEHNQHPAQ